MLSIIFKLALRNVLRNKRRSAITLSTVVIGLTALFFQQSLIESLQAEMVDRAINAWTSHLQIQSSQSEDPKIPQKPFYNVKALEKMLGTLSECAGFSKRVIFTGLAASSANSKGVAFFGIEPEKEKQLFGFEQYVIKGKFISKSGQSVIGSRLAKNLDLRVGEKFVMMGQDEEGGLSARTIRVAGIFETGSYAFDDQIAYVWWKDAQDVLRWGNGINSLAIKLHNVNKLDRTQKVVEEKVRQIGPEFKVVSWKDISAELIHIRKFQDAVLYLILIVIFVIVALGILNTMLMSLFERIREFGLMMSIGAKRKEIMMLLIIESGWLGVTGLFWGALWGAAIISFFGIVGLPLPLGEALSYFMPFERYLHLRFAWSSHIWAGICVIFVSLLAGIIPAFKILHLKAADALRHV
ncbi:ABC transporter permease [Elusimicrobiota bacterium]